MNSIVKVTKYLPEINFIVSVGTFILDISATAQTKILENDKHQACSAQQYPRDLS